MQPQTLQEIRRAYEELLPSLEHCCNEGRARLEALVLKEGVPLAFPIEARIKTVQSLEEKLQRVPLRRTKLTAMQDLVGFRLVTLFKRDSERLSSLVSKAFSVRRRYSAEARLEDDRFGYSSTHVVIRFTSTSPHIDAELQIRTLAQHLWASASERLQYKREESVPSELRRAVYRASALLEGVDEEFERVLLQRDEYIAAYEAKELDRDLDVETLASALNECWPADHKGAKEAYATLLTELTRNDIRTTSTLRSLLAKWREPVLLQSAREAERLRTLAEAYGVKDGRITSRKGNRMHVAHVTGDVIDRVHNGRYYTHTGLTFTALQFESGARHPNDHLDF